MRRGVRYTIELTIHQGRNTVYVCDPGGLGASPWAMSPDHATRLGKPEVLQRLPALLGRPAVSRVVIRKVYA